MNTQYVTYYDEFKGEYTIGNFKKNSAIILAICIISLLIGCTKQRANYKPIFNDIALKTNSTDLKIISEQIMKKYFDEYKKDSVVKELKIKDYTINEIIDIWGNSDKFGFSISYSIKPAYLNSYSLAGNGEVKDSWVVNKFNFVDVEKAGSQYKIINMGTGR